MAMNSEELESILRKISEDIESLEKRFAALELTQQELREKTKATDLVYNKTLSEYRKHSASVRSAHVAAVVVRLLVFLLVVYIAYRVS